MSDERKVQKETPGRYTTNTEPAKGPDYDREAYYGGRADQIIPQPHGGDGTQGQDISEHSAIRSIVGRLRQHPGIGTSRIDVGYDGGIVTLSGGVFSEDVRQRAEQIAFEVPGVNAVHNNIRILPRGLENQPPHGSSAVSSLRPAFAGPARYGEA